MSKKLFPKSASSTYAVSSSMAIFWSTHTICVMFSNGGGNTCAGHWTRTGRRSSSLRSPSKLAEHRQQHRGAISMVAGYGVSAWCFLEQPPSSAAARAQLRFEPSISLFHPSNQTAACLAHAGRPSQAQLLAAMQRLRTPS